MSPIINYDELPFMDYVNAVDAELQRLFFTSIMHDGINFSDLDAAQTEGSTPEQCAKDIAQKLFPKHSTANIQH